MPPRLLATLELVIEGYTNREIADRLLVGEETVKSRVRQLLARYGARSRAHLVTLAMRAGDVA